METHLQVDSHTLFNYYSIFRNIFITDQITVFLKFALSEYRFASIADRGQTTLVSQKAKIRI